ncbi:stilbene cleavage oxidase [Neofusicoccum parvum]|uniref:Stilbene cleavage oxidase n=1 Tax=Neofusicoccum parvum TaxID=310453 RepID=A0ACB5SC33_9PEZI|nr:stilbene cleavage oxidase [Neofusicoccum parvum]GME52327.1 stilbene cleavage oxidase [Neofusicoccum parvum]
MAGHYLKQAPRGVNAFNDKPQFQGFMKPCRYEGEVQNLEVLGEIPKTVDGTFYRVMPDPQFPPFIEDDPWFNGDGNISAFHIQNGKVHFKQRYVRTEKFVREREAGRALIGKYRNKYTDAVEFTIRSTANTNIFYFNGKLLACKEDSPPYLMDPRTLETIGLYDFEGQLPSVTFTAHPKVDPVTGEMVCMGYEAKGDGTPDVCYFSVGADGKFTETVWVVAPVAGMIHDFAVTDNWVIFPIIPLICDVERMKKGGEHWAWRSDVPFYLGVLPRHGAKGSDVKWFQAPNAFPGHTSNAYEDEAGNIIFDIPLCDKNVFFWWPEEDGSAPKPQELAAFFTRFTIDPRSNDLDLPKPEVLSDYNCEFPRVDDRWSMKEYTHSFMPFMDPALGTDFPAIAPVMGGGAPFYNSMGHINTKTKETKVYFPGPKHAVQEPVYIPKSDTAEEGDGYLLFLVNNFGEMISELHLVDTQDFTKPQAIVKLPLKLRPGLHGNWVPQQDLELVL